MLDDDERALRDFLSEAHAALDPEPPGFAETLAAAKQRSERRHMGHPVFLRWAATALVLALVVAVGGRLGRTRPADRDVAEALQLAEELGEWRAPTDFLDHLPGAELLGRVPRFDEAAELLRSVTARSGGVRAPADRPDGASR